MIESILIFVIECLLGLAAGCFCVALAYAIGLLIEWPERRRERRLQEIELARQAADVELRLVASRAMRQMLDAARGGQPSGDWYG